MFTYQWSQNVALERSFHNSVNHERNATWLRIAITAPSVKACAKYRAYSITRLSSINRTVRLARELIIRNARL